MAGRGSLVFDLDGTLVDSQHLIIDAMRATFEARGLPPPADDAVRHIVGLSLGQAIGELVPGVGEADLAALVEGYKQAFQAMRRQPLFHEPLFEGARETLQALERRGHLLAVGVVPKRQHGGVRRRCRRHRCVRLAERRRRQGGEQQAQGQAHLHVGSSSSSGAMLRTQSGREVPTDCLLFVYAILTKARPPVPVVY